MISPPIVDGLNEKQQESVTLSEDINALILAGAGSGKTRVLTHRIHYLVSKKNHHVDDILAVTFTNKAANEMKERLSNLLLQPVGRMWVGTFHSIAHRLLRAHAVEANLSPTFQILDATDQKNIIKRLMKENAVDETKISIKNVQWFINKNKDNGKSSQDIDVGYDYAKKQKAKIFDLYENFIQANDLVDFAGLLVKSYELLKNNQTLLDKYQKKFRHILVDEFQDTNTIQYQFIKILHNQNNHVFCVGDDDQSIYGWRGAKIENIQKIEDDFKPINVIKLEQNYRSTGNILSASNALIANNQNRLEKSLWTASGDGELINVFNARDDREEAHYVIGEIQNQFNQGRNLDEIAILYRSRVQSKNFEDSLRRNNINHVIYGDIRFFERAEIKRAMGYIRLIENKSDNIAFETIVNFPTRGIGLKTIEEVRSHAIENHTDFFQSSIAIIDSLPTRAANALQAFIDLIEEITDKTKNLDLSNKVDSILLLSGLMNHYANDQKNKIDKREHLEKLVSDAIEYVHEEDNDMTETQGFIAQNTLDSSGDSYQSNQGSVQLMTVHAAKGLEFPVVFLVGLEENLFPSSQSKDKPHLIDEERRLCYVGMTRAMQSLTLSYATRRFLYKDFLYAEYSRFLDEIPRSFLNYVKNPNSDRFNMSYEDIKKSSQKIASSSSDSIYSVGQRVNHAKFGMGTILNYEGSGDSMRVQIKFQKAGTKWLISSYAKLEII